MCVSVCKCDECSFFNYCINMDFESVNKDLLLLFIINNLYIDVDCSLKVHFSYQMYNKNVHPPSHRQRTTRAYKNVTLVTMNISIKIHIKFTIALLKLKHQSGKKYIKLHSSMFYLYIFFSRNFKLKISTTVETKGTEVKVNIEKYLNSVRMKSINLH